MNKKKKMLITSLISGVLVIALVCTVLFGTGFFSKTVQAKNLMKGLKSQNVETGGKLTQDFGEKNLEFATELLKKSYESGENVLLSPISVWTALAMTENGADKETLAQMQKVLGGYDLATLNKNMKIYLDSLKDSNITSMANSIWFRNDAKRLQVLPDFLQTNADYYGADAYASDFDSQTLRDMNNWISNHTDGMIKNALDQIPEDAVLYLMNTVLFQEKWETVYTSDMVHEGEFTRADGTKDKASFLGGTEGIYLEDDNATGFMKSYASGRYSFVALLPKGNLNDFVAGLTGDEIQKLIASKTETSVVTSIPKFSYQYKTLLNKPLTDMGMELPFDSAADFSKMADTASKQLYIGRVIHNTSITLSENGTKAGAVTIVEMRDASAPVFEKEVLLDRPFLYMIYDNETGVPVFMGTLNQIS